MAAISIIIPCYNVEDVIDYCMKSIVAQTIGIENMEIILINDASTDQTFDKLKAWERRFPEHILVITYENNLRQGGARNIGMQYASGEYIGFVDADDWIEKEMYALLYRHAVCGHYDMVRGKFIRDNDYGIAVKDRDTAKDCRYFFEKYQGFYLSDYQEVGNCGEFGSICTAIYRKSIILKHQIFFPENMAYEDNYWSDILSLYIKDCYIVDKILYHYVTNSNSTVTGVNQMYHLDRLKIELLKLEKYENLGVTDIPQFADKIEWRFIQYFYLGTMFILFTRFTIIPEDIVNYMIHTVIERFPDWEMNPYVVQLDPLNSLLLNLLKVNRRLRTDEIEKIKELYLNAWQICT